MMDRREFLKIAGAGAAAATLSGCASKRGGKAPVEVPTDKMTYRRNPKTGEQVSLLGYGCMRWPFISGQDGESSAEIIDQQAVNELVTASKRLTSRRSTSWWTMPLRTG